jgi:DNA end-binding protein Ku
LSDFGFPGVRDVRKQELEMARTLIDSLADSWQPDKYTDEYRENLMRVIKAKLKGRKPDLEAPEEPQQAEVVDLMERLRRSLQARGTGSKATDRRKKKKAPKRAASRKRKTAA